MGFVLTIIYLAVTYLSPAALFPQLISYRIQLWIALTALLSSIPSLASSRVLRIPQTKLLVAFVVWASLTPVFALHWFGGVLPAFSDLLANVTVMILVVANCTSMKRVRITVAVLLVIAAYFVVRGAIPYFAGDVTNRFVMFDNRGNTLRIRALSILEDPNDFAQMLVCLIPLVWLFYERQRAVRNFIFCLVPTAFLGWGIFLTHSRGALLALSAVLFFGFRNKLGRLGSIVATLGAFALFTTLNFTGNRVISMSSGADRMEFWGQGFIALKSSPLYGVGYGRFPDLTHGMTAHNSYVLCATELGLIGYFLWLSIVVVTIRFLRTCIQQEKTPEIDYTHNANWLNPLAYGTTVIESFQNGRTIGLGYAANLFQLSLIGFLTAAYFLSRAYIIPFWMLLGLATSVAMMGIGDNAELTRVLEPRLFRWTVIGEILSLGFVYLSLRSRGFV